MKAEAGRWIWVVLPVLAAGQMRAADSCRANQNHGWWGNGSGFAQVREERLPAAALNHVDPGGNGSIAVHGWDKPDVLVKACIQTTAPSTEEARDLASQVKITRGAGHIEASGPSTHGRKSWSVSYDVWMPRGSDTKLETTNGAIKVENLAGRIDFETSNGAVHLEDVGAEVKGETTNGSITVAVGNAKRQRSGMRLETTNGNITLELPADFAARVEASTTNGSIHTDFPATITGDIGKHAAFTIGGGGERVEASTTNGSVHIARRA